MAGQKAGLPLTYTTVLEVAYDISGKGWQKMKRNIWESKQNEFSANIERSRHSGKF
jgi:hypothetical protein